MKSEIRSLKEDKETMFFLRMLAAANENRSDEVRQRTIIFRLFAVLFFTSDFGLRTSDFARSVFGPSDFSSHVF
jgi:hypothetical protein